MTELMRSAYTAALTAPDIVRDLVSELGDAPPALALFFSPDRPGEEVARELARLWPTTRIVGCSSAGELSRGRSTSGGVSAAALSPLLAVRSATALADFSAGVAAGIGAAVTELERTFGPLRALDHRTHAALIFLDSTHGSEELAHVALGNHAPLLPFVGASAGDELRFENTRVLTEGGSTGHGAALMVLELARPFRVAKAQHFEPTERAHVATRVDGRRLLELDGRPAAEVYAEHLGCRPEELSFQTLFMHPAGLVIDGEPWLRQVVPPVQEHGSITLGCSVSEGARLYFMRPRVELIAHLESELSAARRELGDIRGALLFDCALRRLELDHKGTRADYASRLDFPVAGFHTHGESFIGHMHQTLTGIYFG